MTQPLMLSRAHERDAEVIARLSRDLIEVGLPWRWRPQRMAAALRSNDYLAAVARLPTGVVAGFGMLHLLERHAHLVLLAVEASKQRQGTGKRLLRWLEQCALTAGLESVRLEVRASNHVARIFYRSLGYQEIGRLPQYYDGREAAVCMQRSIARMPMTVAREAADRAIHETVQACLRQHDAGP